MRNRYFIVANIDIDRIPGGKKSYASCGKIGLSSWTIFDPSGKVVADNGDPVTVSGNIGYPETNGDLHY